MSFSHKSHFKWWVMLWWLIAPVLLFPQAERVKFERLTIEDGLSQSSVFGIAQDRQGFMWFGTTDGLNRFDGYQFVSYRYQPGLSGSLSNNRIYSIYVDREGVIWIGTGGNGLNRYDPVNDAFIRYAINADADLLGSNNFVTKIYEDQNNDLWIGTRGSGVCRFDRAKRVFLKFIPRNHESQAALPTTITDFAEVRGKLWIASEDAGITIFDYKHHKVIPFAAQARRQLHSQFIPALYADGDSLVWIGTFDAGLYKYEVATETFAIYPGIDELRGRKITSIFRDREGILWIGTSSGLYRLTKSQKGLQRYRHDVSDVTTLGNDLVTNIFEDRSGCLWIGTEGNGLSMVVKDPRNFNSIDRMSNNSDGLNSNIVNSISEDSQGNIWVGSDKGFNRIDRKTNRIEPLFRFPEEASYAAAMSVRMDQHGLPWFGTYGEGLFIPTGHVSELLQLPLEKNNGFFRNLREVDDDFASLSSNLILSIYFDHAFTLWVGTDGGGLNQLVDAESGTFIRHHNDPANAHSINDNDVWSIYESPSERDSILWIGTASGGLNKLNRETNRFTHYKHDPDNPGSISGNRIYVIHESSDGAIWLGTDSGLNRFHRQEETFEYFGANIGFPNDVIYGILEEERGKLWLSTNQGLIRFDPNALEVKTFDVKDGLPSNEFNSRAYYRSRNGRFFFGCIGGLVHFRPEHFAGNVSDYVPPVVITRFGRYSPGQNEGMPIFEKGITAKEHIELSYKDNILTFEFAVLNYRNAHKNQYAYKLEGFNDNWIYLGTKHDVTFTSLAPGEYKLHVKGSNHDGVWNEQGTSLGITVLPPWWQTVWARLLFAAGFLGILYGVRCYEMNRQRLKHRLEIEQVEAQQLQEMDRLKSRFFADISHEFRTPLTLILGPFEKVLARIKDGEARADLRLMQRNAHRLQRMVEQLLDLSRIEARRMPLGACPDDIVQKIREWVASFVSLAESKHITMNLHFPEQPIIAYFDPEKLEKIIYNLLSNAFKFTPEGGEITVAVCSGSGSFEFSVRDSGIGIPQEHLPHILDRFYRASDVLTGEQGGTGIGLALAKEFVELHHGGIHVESAPGKGSTFTVRLPLGRDHLSDDEIVEHVVDGEMAEPSRHLQELKQAETEMKAVQTAATAKNGRPLVLIVEDNDDMRRYLRNCLQSDFEIVEAENGITGQQAAVKKNPDLIISDVMMPEMDGFELCEKLKTDARTSHVPVILLTARASGESKVEGLETGADDYLTKPFDVKELQARVRNLIEQRRRLRERFRRDIFTEPSEITTTSMDEAFLKKVVAAVETHIDDPDFATENLARASGVSRRHLNRKLRALTGQSVREFMRTIRLKRAAQLLQQQAGTVTEIAYEVGFNSIGHFAKVFREQFGVAPSEFSGSSSGTDSKS